MAVTASQWENCGRGVLWMSRKTVVREKWFVDRSPSGAAPAKAGGACGALQVCGCLVPVPVPCVPAWVGQFDGSREMRSHLLQVPQEFISQDWIRPGLAKVQGVTDWQTNKRDRTCEAEAEGGCQGVSALQGPSRCHNTRTNPPTRIARLGRAGGAGCFPNLLSEHGLANTSSNESHHHDHDHATMSLFCLYLTISSQSSTLPTSRFLVSSSPKVPGLRLAWPGRLHRLSAQLDVLWLSQVRPMFVGGRVVRACVWPASLFHLESAGPWIHHLCTQSSFRAINAAARMQHDRRNFLCHLSIPCTHACNPVRALPLELGPNPRSRTRKRRCWTV